MDPLPCERKGGMGMARDFIAVDECNVMHSHPYITLGTLHGMYVHGMDASRSWPSQREQRREPNPGCTVVDSRGVSTEIILTAGV